MPARDVRDTETQPAAPVAEAPVLSPQPEGSVLIVPPRALDLVAV